MLEYHTNPSPYRRGFLIFLGSNTPKKIGREGEFYGVNPLLSSGSSPFGSNFSGISRSSLPPSRSVKEKDFDRRTSQAGREETAEQNGRSVPCKMKWHFFWPENGRTLRVQIGPSTPLSLFPFSKPHKYHHGYVINLLLSQFSLIFKLALYFIY